LRSSRTGNLFFSPQVISTALALTYAGARGDTAAEIARTLHLSLAQEKVPVAYAELLAALNGPGGDDPYPLSIATRLWGSAVSSS
jgi:serpin B